MKQTAVFAKIEELQRRIKDGTWNIFEVNQFSCIAWIWWVWDIWFYSLSFIWVFCGDRFSGYILTLIFRFTFREYCSHIYIWSKTLERTILLQEKQLHNCLVIAIKGSLWVHFLDVFLTTFLRLQNCSKLRQPITIISKQLAYDELRSIPDSGHP